MRLLAAVLLAVVAPASLAGADSPQSPSACAKDPAACERASNLRRPSDYGKALGGVKTPEREKPPRPRVVVIVAPGGVVHLPIEPPTEAGPELDLNEDASEHEAEPEF
jgi:hypothetical protein